MTSDDVRSILAYLYHAYPGKFTIAEQTVMVWSDALADVRGDLGIAAARKLVKEQAWPPSPAEIIETARELGRQAHGRTVVEVSPPAGRPPDREALRAIVAEVAEGLRMARDDSDPKRVQSVPVVEVKGDESDT